MIKIKHPKTHALVEKGCKAINWCELDSKISKAVGSLNFRMNNLLSQEDIEDVLQDTRMKIWANIDSYKSSDSKMETWASRIAINCYYDRLKDNGKWKGLYCSYDNFSVRNGEEVTNALENSIRYSEENEAFAEELYGLLDLILAHFNDTYRKTIECLVNEVPRENMADIIGCSEKNLKSTINRARKATRNSLRKLGIL